MFILFGWRKMQKLYGKVFTQSCGHCSNESDWYLAAITTWFTLFFIPIIPMSTERYLICSICKDEKELTKEEFNYWHEIIDLNKSREEGNITEEEYKQKTDDLKSDYFNS
jgi:hypothetical protein